MKLTTLATALLLTAANVTYAKAPAAADPKATVHIYRNNAVAGMLYGCRDEDQRPEI